MHKIVILILKQDLNNIIYLAGLLGAALFLYWPV